MGMKTLDSFGLESQNRLTGWTAQPIVIAALGTDDVLRIPTTDPATGAIPVAIASGGGGDASAAKQDVGNASLASIDGKMPALVSSAAKQDVGNASLASIDSKVTALASAAKQDTGNASLASIDGKTPTLVSGRQPVVLQTALPAGTNVIGQTGYKLVRVSANFTRPSDTTAYAVGDAVTNSTSSPTVFQLDLGALGAVAGQGVEIRKIAVVSSVKQNPLPLFNVYLNNATFTATNDNAALDIADATMEQGGSWFNCDVQNYTASNSRVAYVNIASPMVLAAADTKLYGTIQAANAYTPVSGEKFTIIAWVALL